MTPVDIWTALGAFSAGSAIAMRAHMLRPHQLAWTAAPACVWLSLSGVALVLLLRAVQLKYGGHATSGEAAVYTALAACSAALLWNLNRSGRIEEVSRLERLRDINEAMAAHDAGHVPGYHLNASKGDPGRGAGQ